MPKEEKTVFISYRRSASQYAAIAIFQRLQQEGYDVFMDVESIAAGDFERIILGEISARAHFLVLLASGTVDRLDEPNDWLRKEIEHALKLERNVIPVLHSDYRFSDAEPHLTGKLSELKKLNALTVPNEYFDAAMNRLCAEFLKIPVYAELKPTAKEDRQEVERKIEAAVHEPAPSPEQITAEDYFNEGYQKWVEGNYEGAIREYTQAIQLVPKNYKIYNNRGLAFDEIGEYFNAIKDYNKAIQLDPQEANSYYNRGRSHTLSKEYRKAIKEYNKAIQLDPQFSRAFSGRGLAFDELGEHLNAIRDYDQAILLNPQFVLAYNNRGRAYAELLELQKAIGDYDKAIQIDPKYAMAYNNRGAAYYELGEYRKAIEEYDKALELDPEHTLAKHNKQIAEKALKKKK